MNKCTRILASTMMAGALVTQAGLSQSQNGPSEISDETIRPFQVHIPQSAVDDLHHRVLATRWPDQETVPDQSQGVPLAKLKELVNFWGMQYDWRKAEDKLNAWPQFITNIDGVDIHFIHVRS